MRSEAKQLKQTLRTTISFIDHVRRKRNDVRYWRSPPYHQLYKLFPPVCTLPHRLRYTISPKISLHQQQWFVVGMLQVIGSFPSNNGKIITGTNFALGSYEKIHPGFRDEKRPKILGPSFGAKLEKQNKDSETQLSY